MNDTDREFLIKHGFVEDADNKMLKQLFTNNDKFSKVNISVSYTEPAMLLARLKKKNVAAEVNTIQKDRLILKKGSSYRNITVIMNILLDEINNCLFKNYGNGLFEFEFEVRGFRYSLHITI